MRCFARIAVGMTLLLGLVSASTVQAENKLAAKWTSKIDADPAKSYKLDKAHGPWMVMVACFHQWGSSTEKHEGVTPMQAAEALVLELRRLKIPAYVYEIKGKNESVKSQDALGREQRMKNMRIVDSVCVLAGNYPLIDDPKAQQTLKFIKQLHPKSFEKGVVYGKSPGRPGPLSKAFLAPNPLLTAEELESTKQSSDPLLVSLNNDEQFSLYENKGKYTLVVAKFAGKSINVVNETMEKAEGYFIDGGNDLDQAALSARKLVKALRSREPVTTDPKFAAFCRMDAYVWHDYTSSIVTVGSFESMDDPSIKKYMEMFGPKTTISESGSSSVEYGYLPIPKKVGGFDVIPFDPSMRMMIVPGSNKK